MSVSRPRSHRRLTVRLRLVLLVTGLFLGLLILEIALRCLGISCPVPYAPDSVCGSRLQPDFTGLWTKEGRATFHTNGLGFRDVNHTRSRTADTLRIAVLGDSYMEGLQVADEAIFARQLESELTEQLFEAGRKVEVLNFGISGWGTAQELLALRQNVLQFEPDVVLLAFLPANDVRNNSRTLEPMQCRPFFDLIDDRLVLDDSFLNHPDFLLSGRKSTLWKNRAINASRVLQLIQAVRNRNREQPRTTIESGSDFEAGLEEMGLVPPVTHEWSRAWELTDRLVIQMATEVQEHGSIFSVMSIPSSVQVDPDPARSELLQKKLRVSDLEYADHRLQGLADTHHFLFISLTNSLRAWAEQTQTCLHGFAETGFGTGHWNENGHREAAKVCAEALKPALYSRSQLSR